MNVIRRLRESLDEEPTVAEDFEAFEPDVPAEDEPADPDERTGRASDDGVDDPGGCFSAAGTPGTVSSTERGGAESDQPRGERRSPRH